jgi:hypothetical protein
MAHNRKIVLGGSSLTNARLRRFPDIEVAPKVMDEIEQLMISSGYLNDAPFTWVGLMLRYGLQNEDIPHYEPINQEYGDLPLAIELDTHELLESDRETLKRRFMLATLKALIHAGHKYGLPTHTLEARQKEILSQTK